MSSSSLSNVRWHPPSPLPFLRSHTCSSSFHVELWQTPPLLPFFFPWDLDCSFFDTAWEKKKQSLISSIHSLTFISMHLAQKWAWKKYNIEFSKSLWINFQLLSRCLWRLWELKFSAGEANISLKRHENSLSSHMAPIRLATASCSLLAQHEPNFIWRKSSKNDKRREGREMEDSIFSVSLSLSLTRAVTTFFSYHLLC